MASETETWTLKTSVEKLKRTKKQTKKVSVFILENTIIQHHTSQKTFDNYKIRA